jgi:hypothetical protein
VGEDEEKKGRPFEKRSWKPSRSPALVDASSTQFSVVDSHHHHMYTHERKKRREEKKKHLARGPLDLSPLKKLIYT